MVFHLVKEFIVCTGILYNNKEAVMRLPLLFFVIYTHNIYIIYINEVILWLEMTRLSNLDLIDLCKS